MTSITTREIDSSQSLIGSSSAVAADASAWQKALASAAGDGDLRQSTIEATLGASVVTPATAVNAQSLGQSEAVQEFSELMDRSPEERMRAQILGSMGLTEEDLAAMTPEERKKIEARIQEAVETRIQAQTEEKTAEAAEAASAPIASRPTAEAAQADTDATEGASLLPFPFKTDAAAAQSSQRDDTAA